MISGLHQREKNILYLTIAVVIFALLFNFIVWPLFTKSENLSRQIKVNRAKLGKYLWLLDNKEMIRQEYARYIPPASDAGQQKDPLVSALKELENLAKNAGIKIIDLRPQAGSGSGDGPYRQAVIDVRTEGTMDNYLKFFYSIENSLSLMKVQSFQLTQRSDSGLLEGSFSIIKYISF